jgi:hypothetical protein
MTQELLGKGVLFTVSLFPHACALFVFFVYHFDFNKKVKKCVSYCYFLLVKLKNKTCLGFCLFYCLIRIVSAHSACR